MLQEVEFRDGKRWVHEHVAAMMESIETYRMTYDEAVAAAEKKLLGDLVYGVQQGLISDHFREIP